MHVARISNHEKHFIDLFYRVHKLQMPIPVAARSKAQVCGLSLAGIAGSNPARGFGCLSLVNFVCCQVSATGRSLVQRSPTECVCVTECD